MRYRKLRINRMLPSVLALGLMLSVLVFMVAPGPVVATESPGEGVFNPCRLYGSAKIPRQDAQLFTIDLKENTTQLLGETIADANISGLAVHPDTLDLYALFVSQRGAKAASLMRVETATGAMELIDELGFEFGEGLSFRTSDNTLWAWWREHGLVQIDPTTAEVQLVRMGDLPVSALAWDPEGNVLYLVGNRSLWIYQEGSADFELIQEPLPVLVGGMTVRGDGQLLFTGANTGAEDLDLLLLDPDSGQVAATFSIPSLPIDAGRAEDDNAAFVQSLAWPIACGNASPGGPTALIASVQIEPDPLCSGESALVQVETIHPEGSDNPVMVSINGLPGHQRALQFEGMPGPRLVNVSATTNEGYVDGGTWEVELIECGPEQPFARLFTGMNPYHAYTVDFLVENAADIAPEGTQYQWEFGDGMAEITTVPFISHSYENNLPPDQEYVTFQASVTLLLPDGSSLQTPQTVSVWNAYAAGRERGVIQPLLSYEPELNLAGGQLLGEYTMRNLEGEAIQFSQRQVELQPCNPSAAADPAPWEAIDLQIPAGETWTGSLMLNASDVPEDVCGVALHLAGQLGSQGRTAADIYFQVKRDPDAFRPVSDPATLEMLASVVEQGLVSDPDLISDETLHQLSYEGRITLPPPAQPPVVAPDPPAVGEPADCDVNPIQIGCPCDRGTVADELPPNVGDISCQATQEFANFPPHLPNALKGDAILVGGCGFVGEMLRVLGQRYVHTGIMTQNYTEIAHSTSTDKRANNDDHLEYLPTPHINAYVLRYGWPGIIRSDVGSAFSRLPLTDSYGDTYIMTDFSPEPAGCSGAIVPPLVVKPPPALDQAVRPLLHQAAEFARGLATPVDEWEANGFDGTGNYRFAAYSNATIAFNPDYDYPGGEPATVCSTFVWYAMKNAGINLEGPSLEPEEISRNWRHGFIDGLYLYPEALRQEGGQFMWDNVHEMVMEKSFFDPLFDEIADAIANQLTNCFASDGCDFWDSYHQDWKYPGIGVTVSPDNLLLWDPPTDMNGDGQIDYGVYGHSERLVFRSGGYKRVYRWMPSQGTGTVTGEVRYQDGSPAADATVLLEAASGLVTSTGSDGRFEFLAVPAGIYEIEAQKQFPHMFLSSRDGLVRVVNGQTFDIILELLPPSENLRHVIFEDDLYHSGGQDPDPEHDWPHYHGFYHYDVDWGFLCFTYDWRWRIGDVINLACRVDPYCEQPDAEGYCSGQFWWQDHLGDSYLTLQGTCRQKAYAPGVEQDLSVQVNLTGSIGSASQGRQFTLAPGASESFFMEVKDKDYCGAFYEWDIGKVWLRLTNDVQNY